MLVDKPRIPFRDLLLYGFWPGFIKAFLYRLRGYKIAKGVSLGFGSVICGDHVEIGENTSLGFLTIIRGNTIRLGPYVQIGSMTFLDTPHIEIGEGTKINEQVFVGGLQFPDSRFIVGRNCHILQMSFINPARSIVMGDDSGIGGHSLMFGHSSFQNCFEGYSVDFAPIEIGNNVGLAWRTFVLPGTRIGDGTMVGAGSIVSGTIPENCMVAGFPARIVGRPPVFPKAVSAENKVAMFRKIVAEMIQYFQDSGLECRQDGDRYTVRQRRGKWRTPTEWKMLVTDGAGQALKHRNGKKVDVILSLFEIPNDLRADLAQETIAWIDVAKKEQSRLSNNLSDEISNYLRRYGVRTLRYPPLPGPGGVPSEAGKSHPDLNHEQIVDGEVMRSIKS